MTGLVVTVQRAHEVPVGAFLNPSRTVRVHSTLTRNGRTVLAWRQRGSKAPGVTVKSHLDNVKTYAKMGA